MNSLHHRQNSWKFGVAWLGGVNLLDTKENASLKIMTSSTSYISLEDANCNNEPDKDEMSPLESVSNKDEVFFLSK